MNSKRNDVEQLVREALVDWRFSSGTNVTRELIEVGDIVRVSVDRSESDTLTRLVVVTHVNMYHGHFSFLLSHFNTEFLTSTDLLIPRVMAKIFADLVVETELFGTAFLSQIDQKFGQLDESVMQEVLAYQRGGDISPTSLLKSGTVVHGEYDEKWSFKEDEARSIMLIKADFLGSLLDELKDRNLYVATSLEDEI